MVSWLVLAFWISLAIDFLPVLFGFDELSQASRCVALGVCVAGMLWIFYRNILRRVFVGLNNESMALLVERNYPAFNETLVTSVNQLERDSEDSAPTSMQIHTRQAAESIVSEVQVASILNSRALKRLWLLAGCLVLSVVVLVASKPSFARHAAARLYRLDATPWPRRCNIELIGIKIARQNPVQDIQEFGQTIVASDGKFKIARGNSVTLLVRAEAESTSQNLRVIPENCRMFYKSEEGGRGNVSMNRIGSPKDGFQLFTFDEQPLAGIISDIEIEIRGGDHRIGPFLLTVVDQPAVISTVLACEFPDYMVDPVSGRWTPREIPWSGPMELPVGTRVSVRSTANKPLRKVYLLDEQTQEMERIEVTSDNFEVSIPFLSEPFKREIYLCDDDGLVSEQAFVLSISPIQDQPPSVQNRLKGIGIAITPNVRIPVSGEIEDDYGVGRAWIEVETPDQNVLMEPLNVDSSEGFDSAIDFLAMQRMNNESGNQPAKLSTKEGSTISLVVKAEDRFNLTENPNLGLGDKYTLDVVDANKLLRILERKEVAQRRRLEQIYLETADARGFLSRTSENVSRQPTVLEPGDEPEDLESISDTKADPRRLESRLLFTRRTLMQLDKSLQELIGVVAAFENIRLQLINNRIDAEDRKLRINRQVELPLRNIIEYDLPALRASVVELETNLTNLAQGAGPATQEKSESDTRLAVAQVDRVLIELNRVLDALIKYETQNELLEIVRDMIKQQQQILEKTRQERQRKAFEGLLD